MFVFTVMSKSKNTLATEEKTSILDIKWKWIVDKKLNLNISFTYFNLHYSGEACIQERINIYTRDSYIIGRYCGRRYNWSVFAASAPIVIHFYTFTSSNSQFSFLL